MNRNSVFTRQRIIRILLLGYVVSIITLTIYHAFNFSTYIHWKGDETIYYTFFLFFTSVLFQGLAWMISRKIEWKAALIATIGNYILSFFVGLGVLAVSGLSGIPRHLIFVYGACHVTFFIIVTVSQSSRLAGKENRLP